MRLGIRPAVFLGRLLAFFFLTYVLWKPVAPAYTRVLATLTRSFLHLTELSSDPRWHHVTEMAMHETADDRPAIFFQHRLFPMVQSGIPADWVQANLVLLIPLMLATPARTWRQKLWRMCLALGLAVALQVLDIALVVKFFYAEQFPDSFGRLAYKLYQFGYAFSAAMDTQLFPFAIWAGIHFNQLLGRGAYAAAPSAPAGPLPRPPAPRHKRKRKKTASAAKAAS